MSTLPNQTKSKDLLNKKQIHALSVLASTSNYSQAAKELGISTERIYLWLKNPLFKSKLEKLRTEIVSGAITKLKEYASQAVDTLVSLLEDAKPTVRLKAANHILDHVCKYMAIQEMNERLEQLEDRYQQLRKLK